MAEFPFLGGDFKGRSPSFDAQRTVNLFPELSESGTSRGPVALFGTPGLELWANLSTGRVRGCIRFTDGIAVVVAGVGIWLVTSAAVATQIGTVQDTGPVVSMASNGSLVMMVDGPNGYFIDPVSATVTKITDPDFTGADTVDFVDGYFIWNKPDTGQFQITQLYGTDIDTLDFATAEGAPDNIISLIVDHREVWLFGQNSAEVDINNGNPDFPFSRIQGAFLEIGCAAAHSVAKADNSIFWLSVDDRGFGTIQRAVGYAPQRVSNHAVEFAIASYDTIADAVAYTYSQEGHTFYVISFPSASRTWALDISNGLWHERAWRDPVSALLERHRSNCQMTFAGLTIVGDWENGNLYRMGLDIFTDNGAALASIRACPHIASDTKYTLHHALELTMQTGIGLTSGQGSNPQAMLRWSDDGGYSWSSEHWAPIGAIGATKDRVRWRRLGKSRDRIYEVTVSDPVRRVFTGASLQTSACAV